MGGGSHDVCVTVETPPSIILILGIVAKMTSSSSRCHIAVEAKVMNDNEAQFKRNYTRCQVIYQGCFQTLVVVGQIEQYFTMLQLCENFTN